MKIVGMQSLLNTFLIALLLMLSSVTSHAVVEIVQFKSEQQEQLYRVTIEELRCVVCQNQNLADSDAPLARDLREITAEMVREGKNKEQIMQFMVQRYGEFVLYRPPLSAATSFLWFGPIVLLFLTLLFAIRFILNRQKERPAQSESKNNNISDAHRKEIQRLLSDDQQAMSESKPDA